MDSLQASLLMRRHSCSTLHSTLLADTLISCCNVKFFSPLLLFSRIVIEGSGPFFLFFRTEKTETQQKDKKDRLLCTAVKAFVLFMAVFVLKGFIHSHFCAIVKAFCFICSCCCATLKGFVFCCVFFVLKKRPRNLNYYTTTIKKQLFETVTTNLKSCYFRQIIIIFTQNYAVF